MVKRLLHSLFTALAIAVATNVSAQTFYVGMTGLSSAVDGYEGRILSFDLADVSKKSSEFCKIPTSDDMYMEDSYYGAGTTVENSYYALIKPDYSDSYWASVNFESGTLTKLPQTGPTYSVLDMTYDPVTKQVYFIRNVSNYDGEVSSTNTIVSTLNITDGSVTDYCTLQNVALSAIAADANGKIYGVSVERTGDNAETYVTNVELYSVDMTAKQATMLREIGSFNGTAIAHTMAFNESDGKLYFLTGKKLFTINPDEGDIQAVDGNLPLSGLSGLTFTMSTADKADLSGSGDEEPVEVSTVGYFATLSSPGSYLEGNDGRVFAVDLAGETTLQGEFCMIPGVEISSTDIDYYTIAGASVGDTYYAYVEADGADYPEYYLYSYNFNGDEAKKIATLSSTDVVADVMDMAYDAANGKLYAVRPNGDNTEVYTVSLTDGALTLSGTIEGVKLYGITFDADGNAYGVQNIASGSFPSVANAMSLCTLDLSAMTATKKADLKSYSTSSEIMSHTMAFNGERLYFAYGSGYVMSFLPDGSELKEVRMTVRSRVAGLTFTKSTATAGSTTGGDEEEDTGLRVAYNEIWGTAMGDVPSDVASKRTYFYYDSYNNLVREAVYGRLFTDAGGVSDNWEIEKYIKYDYDENHRLISTHQEQWGQYSGEDYAFKATGDTINYEYDEQGRLSKEINASTGSYTMYQYDDADQLVYEARMNPDTYGTHGGEDYAIESKAYSDFVAFNKPQTVKGDGAYDSYKCVIKNAYDEDFNCISSTKYNADESQIQEFTENTYRNDSLVETVTYKRKYTGETYEDTPTKRLTYVCIDGNPNIVREISWEYDKEDKTFHEKPTSNVDYYTQYSATYAPTDLKAEKVEGDINTYELSFVAPNIPSFGDVYYNVYRQGKLVNTISQNTDGALNPETGRFTFVDKNLPNGLYDYMVQTVIKDELGDSTTYNVSNCISITPFVKLPTVTNLHFVKYENNNGSNLVTVAWDAPENLDPALRFERYNVFITELGMRAAENNEEDGQPTEYTLTFRWPAEHIYVQSQYHYGKVNSDTIYVDLETVGVSEVAQDVADGKVSISASEISVDGVASAMMIYNVGGGLVASYKNVSRADISALRQGVYVALITVDGKNVALKFTK